MVNRKAKGDRLERAVKRELEKYGFIVYKPVRSRFVAQKDIFNLFDLVAYSPYLKELLFIQVSYDKYHAMQIENSYQFRNFSPQITKKKVVYPENLTVFFDEYKIKWSNVLRSISQKQTTDDF